MFKEVPSAKLDIPEIHHQIPEPVQSNSYLHNLFLQEPF
jgi:hypothetical protein